MSKNNRVTIVIHSAGFLLVQISSLWNLSGLVLLMLKH